MVFVLGLLLASVGAYLLGRELIGRGAAILGAASFTLCPYVLFIDPHARGDLAEHFAICLLPFTFCFFHRLICCPRRTQLLGSVLSLAALVFSHNLLGLVGSLLLLAYWVWHALFASDRPRATRALLAFALAAALIAFFWLPAVAERRAVKLQVTGPGHFDFREHFLSLGELLAPSRPIDWGATGPRVRHNLGVSQWLLGVPALAALVKRFGQPGEAEGRRGQSYFAVAGLGLIFLTLPPSTLIWERVPVMPYLQFPWRLLGPANMMLAVYGASGVTLLPGGLWRRIGTGAAFALVVTTALPMLYPQPWSPDFGGTEPADMIEWERKSQALGTTSTGDFLPVNVKMNPGPIDTLIHSYARPGPVDKVNRATVPDGAEVNILEHGPQHDRFYVTTPKGFRLRLYTFYFPGWRAYVDGEEVGIEVARPEGFITLQVPAGQREVLVRFEDTLPRRVGWAISGAAVVALAAVWIAWPGPADRRLPSAAEKAEPTMWALVGGILLTIAAVKVAVIDRCDWLHYNSPPGQAKPAQSSLQTSFEGKIELLGYDLLQPSVRPGETLSVVLYWHALTDIEQNYQSFVHIAQPLDVVWAQEDHLNPGGLPTELWPRDKYVWDEYEIHIGPETPPGEYVVNVGLYLGSDGYRLKRLNAEGEAVGDSKILGPVQVVGGS
jgi:hypothetical protein